MPNLFEYSDTDFYVFHARDEKPAPEHFRMHAHPDPEIFFFISGKGTYRIEGTLYPLRAGDVLIMRTAETHMLEIDPACPYERLVYNIRPEFLDKIDPSGALWRMFFDRPLGGANRYRPACTGEDEFFKFLYRRDLPGTPIRTLLLSRLLTALGEASVHYAEKRERAVPRRTPDRAGEVIRYLNMHLSEPLTLDDIASRFYLSRSQLCRIFREATGSGVMEYIRIKRLVAAREQISAGVPAARAAAACGFRDYSSFFRAYKARFGTSPGRGEE